MKLTNKSESLSSKSYSPEPSRLLSTCTVGHLNSQAVKSKHPWPAKELVGGGSAPLSYDRFYERLGLGYGVEGVQGLHQFIDPFFCFLLASGDFRLHALLGLQGFLPLSLGEVFLSPGLTCFL